MNIIRSIVARFRKPEDEAAILGTSAPLEKGPYDGWGFFVLDVACRAQKQPGAYTRVLEDYHTLYEFLVMSAIQERFQQVYGLEVPAERIYNLEHLASKELHYYQRLAEECWAISHANEQ